MTTKIHMVTDGLGNPLRFLLSGGDRNDICMAQAFLEPFDLTGELILADKGYDSDKLLNGSENGAGSLSYRAVSLPNIPDRPLVHI